MTTCPYCGTTYPAFQPNCKNCGAPLQPLETALAAQEVGYITPPMPPRPISNNYIWRLMLTDGWAITALVFGLLGVVFAPLGVLLTVFIITAFVGIPFALIGFAMLGLAGVILTWRYRQASQTVEVLRNGDAARGQVLAVQQNYNVQVNGRNPWLIDYQFEVVGQDYRGRLTTLTPPGASLQPGKTVCVLYSPAAPEQNTLYPHP